MKHLKQFLSDARRHKGLALIIVLSMLALATIVILAFLSVADTEHKATITFTNSQSARRFADTAVNVVIAQIRSGSQQDTGIAGREIHATQPGSVRKYTQSGAFLAGYKLFSDANLIFRPPNGVAGNSGAPSNLQERTFVAESEPPSTWNTGYNLSRYTDLNEPAVKGTVGRGGAVSADAIQTYFPIIDPRAAQEMDPGGANIPAEGFSYSNLTAINNNNLGGDTVVKMPPVAAARLSDLRLPMPVQWLYLLKDGTMGYLSDSPELRFTSSSGEISEPSAENPIVGRVAFWTDDETCKVNINVASEPTFLGQPIYYHERDHRWADYTAASHEYQRFAGHPATIALSSIFYPNPFQDDARTLDNYRKTGPQLTRILSIKDRIYNLAPKIQTGGSQAGTKYFDFDAYNPDKGNIAATVDLTASLNERLYASVDELLFSAEASAGKRKENTLDITGSGATNVLFNKQTLERASAFLTANSRASEINMFGLPRIAMWPVDTADQRRTGFDKLVRFCSTLNGHEYLFSRSQPRNANYDIAQIPRNANLMTMLDKIMDQKFPSKSDAGGEGISFKTKLGNDNARQVLVEMFDYIRSTNLYDGFLVPQDRGSWETVVGNVDWVQTYIKRDQVQSARPWLTYTPGVGRNATVGNTSAGNPIINDPFADRFWPGHGQVTPSSWRPAGAPHPYRGFGRSISISEIGLQFICTADGQPDMYSWRIPKRNATGQPTEGSGEAYKFTIPPYADGDLEQAVADGIVSGGRTALKINPNVQSQIQISHDFARGFSASGQAKLVNLTDANVWWQNDDDPANEGKIKERYYSNYPPLDTYAAGGLYGTTPIAFPATHPNYGRNVKRHPGYDPANWNWTLDKDKPLEVKQKRIQAALHLEFFCAAVGFTDINPEFTCVLDGEGVSSIQVDGKAVFSTKADVVLKSNAPLFELDGTPQVGGFAAFRKIAQGRRCPGRGTMPEDAGYDTNASGSPHFGSLNLDLLSSFFTVARDTPLTFSSGNMVLKLYDSHDYQHRDPIQVINFRMDQGTAPTPDLVVRGSSLVDYVRADGSRYHHPAIQAPRWWSFNRDGCLNRYDELGNRIDPDVVQNAALSAIRGRVYRWDSPGVNSTIDSDTRAVAENTSLQRVPGARAIIYGKDANFPDVKLKDHSDLVRDPLNRIRYEADHNTPEHFGSDTVRSLQPKGGDPRIIAAKAVVPASDWIHHRFWDDQNAYLGHNFSSYTNSGNIGAEAGFDYGQPSGNSGVNTTVRVLPPAITAGAAYDPDAPHTLEVVQKAQRYYDFDDTDPGGRVGPFVNKPDEGNFAVGDFILTGWPTKKRYRFSYFRASSNGYFAGSSGSFFSPNRMISSPVMMGSLPSRIWDDDGNGAWTNLLFRPHVRYPSSGSGGSIGSTEATHPGAASPPDHYLLDLFWMPVVEPYAISEALSTAGKVNMNYQMLPFTHIRRATALHAVMKGEIFAALPNGDFDASRSLKSSFGPNGGVAPVFRDEANDSRYWHRSIVIDRFKPTAGTDTQWWKQSAPERVVGTLRQFEERFNFGTVGGAADTSSPFRASQGGRGGLFRTASQLCELHLIPSNVPNATENITPSNISGYTTRNAEMGKFWGNHCATGDNTRERPYSNLYAKLTTRSNTFRVHVRAQSISKATRSVRADVFDPANDKVTAEFRGSFLIERYIDTHDAANPLPDYADGGDPFAKEPLESFYRFRILESKRFAP